MGHLPESVRQRSFCELALPCCHNAGARQVKCIPSHTLAKYVGESMARMPMVSSIAMPFASGAAVCQGASIRELLDLGARILDFRVGMHEGEIYICHTVVCELTLQEALREVLSFLEANADEVVALLIKRDWEHRDFDTDDNWMTLQAVVGSVFGDLLANDISLPLQALTENGTRVLVLLEAPADVDVFCGIRSSKRNLDTSWRPTTKTVEDMICVLGEWRDSGRMQPERSKLKLVEVALPGSPSTLAVGASKAFCTFVEDVPLAVGVNLDFPDEPTVRIIVGKNWV